MIDLDTFEIDYINLIEDFEIGNINQKKFIIELSNLKKRISLISQDLYNRLEEKRYTFLVQIIKREFKNFFFKDFYSFYLDEKLKETKEVLNMVYFNTLNDFNCSYYDNLCKIDNAVIKIFNIAANEKFKINYRDLYYNNFNSIKDLIVRNLADKEYKLVNNFMFSILKKNTDNTLAEFIKNTVVDNIDNHRMVEICSHGNLGRLLEDLVNKEYYTEFFDNLVKKNDPEYLDIIYLLEEERFLVHYRQFLVNNALFLDLEFNTKIALFMEFANYENVYKINRMLKEIENRKIIDSNFSMITFAHVPWKVATNKDIKFPGKEMIEKQYNDSGKTILWNENLIFGTIEINGIDVTMTLPMVNIILKFNEHDKIPYNKKCSATYHLIKNKILLINKEKQIIKINNKFTYKSKTMTIQNTPIKKKNSNQFADFKLKCEVIKLMKNKRKLSKDSIKRKLKLDEKATKRVLGELSKDEFIKIEADLVSYIP